MAILQLPLFWAGHLAAQYYGYPADGFSPPYQYALGFGIIFYCFLALLLLRRVLMLYFSDISVALTLIMVCLATNFLQYAAVDNAQSHAYIFPLYVLILYITIKWHQKPGMTWAALAGYTIGLATICRPTEAIMLFIPLFWNTQNKDAAAGKWALVKQHRAHFIWAICFGFIGILPQLIYWKVTSGSFIYDVGSSWRFFSPYFRVLFGWEKGWFIYTPITIFFIIGMFYMKQRPFQRSVLWFCLLNMYIIIAWSDWRYGGSYSTRALVQSYPLFALPFAAFTQHIQLKKWRLAFYILCAWLLFVNLFQVTQYNKTILHYDDMNRLYYSRIFLNPNPTPIDMSLLDNPEVISNEDRYHRQILPHTDSTIHINFTGNSSTMLIGKLPVVTTKSDTWLKVACTIKAPGHLWGNYLTASLQAGDSVKQARVRLFSPISKDGGANEYAFYMKVPAYFSHSYLSVSVTGFNIHGAAEKVMVTQLEQ